MRLAKRCWITLTYPKLDAHTRPAILATCPSASVGCPKKSTSSPPVVTETIDTAGPGTNRMTNSKAMRALAKCTLMTVLLAVFAVQVNAITRKFRLYNVATGEKINAAFKFK